MKIEECPYCRRAVVVAHIRKGKTVYLDKWAPVYSVYDGSTNGTRGTTFGQVVREGVYVLHRYVCPRQKAVVRRGAEEHEPLDGVEDSR